MEASIRNQPSRARFKWWRDYLLIALACLLSACTLAQPVAFETGKVIDTVRCQGSPLQSYALYLPKDYLKSHPLGVIFLYDPGARGILPVSTYQALAERYQLILVCSNNSRNGPFSLPIEAEAAILPDVKSRFSIDSKQLFISGFSGGARAAVHLAMQNPIYAGILACGAAASPDDQQTLKDPIPFVEMVGNRDMNFSEGITMKGYLGKIKYPHSILLFEGPHQWPPVEIFSQALYWQMGNHGTIEQVHLDHYKQMLKTLVQQQLDSSDVYQAWLNVAPSPFQPSTARGIFDSLKMVIEAHPDFEKQRNSFAPMQLKEENTRQEFNRRLMRLQGAVADSVFKESDWRAFIASQNKLIKSKDRQEALMGERIVGVMRISCYETYGFQFRSRDFFHATFTARLMTLLDNQYRSHLALARTYAARNMKREAIQSLKKSVALGLKERRVLESDPYLQTLRDEKGFQEILAKMN